MLFAVFLLTLLTHFDYPLYKTPIGRVQSVRQISSQNTHDYYQNTDQNVTQRLKIRFLNTKRRGQTIYINNQYLKSQVMTQSYHPGQQLLLNRRHWWAIIGLKRDTVLVFVLATAVAILFVITNKMSFQIIISMAANFIFFLLAIIADINFVNISAVFIFAVLTIVFAFFTLLMVLGKSRQFFTVFLSTVLSTSAGVGIGALTIALNGARGIHFEYMDFVTQFPIPLFYSQLMIGVLGAVMDEASDIIAMMFGMQRENADRSFADYFRSGMRVGRDIVGSLTNVLFMVFIADTLPMVFLYLRNGNTWSYTIEMTMMLGMFLTVISAIGIVLTVPITSWLASLLLTKKTVKEPSK